MNLKIFNSQSKFTNSSVNFIFKICKKNQQTNIAISGGSTPFSIYKALAKKLQTFTHTTLPTIHFYQTDERYVPATNPNSNQKMIIEAFWSIRQKQPIHIPYSPPAPAFHLHFFDTSLSIKKSLSNYAKKLPEKPFDLTILGIGADGHTASLFPHSKNLNSKSLTTHTTTREPLKNSRSKNRLTLTFNPILKSKKILILLNGKAKLPILKTLQTLTKNPTVSVSNFPALKLLKHQNLTIHFCKIG